MNNNISINRVEAAIQQWQRKEERFSKLFSFALSRNRALLSEKLQYYDGIASRYRYSNNVDERFALRLLKQERRQIEKQLYPNLAIRLLRRLLALSFREQITVRQDIKKAQENNQTLQHQLHRAGFTGLSAKLEEQMKQEQPKFSVPVSYYVNEKERMDYQLSFAKDEKGQYRLEGYTANLHNEAKPNEQRRQYFVLNNDTGIDATEAYNLLSGRAIQQAGTWMQLDMNDKDAQGNFRIKQFHANYGYDLENALKQLPLKELQDKNEAQKLYGALKTGSCQSVTFIQNGHEHRYYIEANPQFRSINIYDEHSKKITLNTALGNKTMEAVKLTPKLNQQLELSHAKRNGMRVS